MEGFSFCSRTKCQPLGIHVEFKMNTFQPLGNTDSDKMEAIPVIGGAIAAVVVLTIVIVSIIVYKR